jgi:hypothetical protein
MPWLRRLWQGRDWMLIPLGALVLMAAGWSLIDLGAGAASDEPPRYRTDWAVSPGDANAGPTVGMTLSEDGYGTVTDAPAVEAPMASAEARGSVPVPMVASDVARFVRAWPRQVRLNPPADGMTVCTLEGQPRYAGRLVLIDGCLRFQPANSASPGPLVLAGGAGLSRDADNYLAIGSPDAPPEYRLRVGEPDGVFIGIGCSMDAPVPAPPELARQCGVGEMVRLGTIKRKPVCSRPYLERRRELQRQERETTARLRRDRDACVQGGGTATKCPPAAFPADPELFDPPCRLPAAAS